MPGVNGLLYQNVHRFFVLQVEPVARQLNQRIQHHFVDLCLRNWVVAIDQIVPDLANATEDVGELNSRFIAVEGKTKKFVLILHPTTPGPRKSWQLGSGKSVPVSSRHSDCNSVR